jgi:hypothetical protein
MPNESGCGMLSAQQPNQIMLFSLEHYTQIQSIGTRGKPVRFIIAILLIVGLCPPLWAQNDEPAWPRIEELTWMDRNHLAKQREVIDGLARFEFGRPVRGNKSDLRLLQRFVDERLIPRSDIQELQALGAVLGEVYVQEYDLVWRSYEDEKGRSHAVCVENSNNCLFPITMLSRRIVAGLIPDVEKIYNNGIEIITPYLPKRPFDGQ